MQGFGSFRICHPDRIDRKYATQKRLNSNSGGIPSCAVWISIYGDPRIFKKSPWLKSPHPYVRIWGSPSGGGPVDPRFGSVGKETCPTCGQTKECHGHWGFYRLPEPLWNENWISETAKWLKNICTCGERLDQSGKSLNTCPSCHKKNGKYTWDRSIRSFRREEEQYSAKEALEKFERSGEHDAVRLILRTLPIPPIHVRPPNIVNGLCRGQSDLTYRIVSIVRAGKHILESKRAPKIVRRHAVDALQEAVSCYFDADRGTRKSESKYSYSSLAPMLKGKRGLIRGHLMGKRVDQSARAVIVGDDCLKPQEVGVPRKIARTLTVPLKVTLWNKRGVQKILNEDGAAYISQGRRKYDLKYSCPSLEVGMVVHRYLRDGDILLLNRQPSLHTGSLMAHEAKIVPGNTIRINSCVTGPYNADFDGDEMNLHAPQGVQSRAEAMTLLSVSKNVLSSNATPSLGCIQDTLLGAWLLSQEKIPESLFQMCAGLLGEYSSGVRGKDLLSLCFPPVNYQRGEVRILRGKFIAGSLSKKDLGSARGGLIHRIALDFGEEEALACIARIQKIAHTFLEWRGFSIGLSDAIPTEEYRRETQRVRVEALCRYQQTLDPKHLRDLKDALGQVKGIQNSFSTCIQSGAKGNTLNMTSLMSLLGTQTVRGEGPSSKSWGGRTLPHFKVGETKPESLGFVGNSYGSGLSPTELFFHAASGREGLIDTSIKTSRTGYLSRRLMKTLENLCTEGQMVKDGDQIVQFLYAECGDLHACAKENV